MPNRPSAGRNPERGAALIHMAIAMVAVMAFSALVIDYGIFWVARRQAQNSADAGALAGAMALAFDNPTDFSSTGPAKQNAMAAALANAVWGLAPSVLDTDVTFPACPDNPADTCIKVDVFRTVARSNSLPTFFGKLVGVNTQDVQATATAMILSGTQSNCLRPWAVADKWQENVQCTDYTGNKCSTYGPPNPSGWRLTDTYDKWIPAGGGPWVVDPKIAQQGQTPDYYRAPGTDGETDPGTGFRLENPDGSTADYGQFIQLKVGGGQAEISPGWFLIIDMANVYSAPDVIKSTLCDATCQANAGGGANIYKWTIENCVGGTAGIGDYLRVETGAKTGATGSGAYSDRGDSLYEQDPGAYWDDTTKEIKASCAPGVCADGRYHAQSPRIVPVALFDADSYFTAGYTGANGYARITNVFGFFILSKTQGDAMATSKGLVNKGTTNDTVYGIMVSAPGLTSGGSTIPPTSSFLLTIVLVR